MRHGGHIQTFEANHTTYFVETDGPPVNLTALFPEAMATADQEANAAKSAFLPWPATELDDLRYRFSLLECWDEHQRHDPGAWDCGGFHFWASINIGWKDVFDTWE